MLLRQVVEETIFELRTILQFNIQINEQMIYFVNKIQQLNKIKTWKLTGYLCSSVVGLF